MSSSDFPILADLNELQIKFNSTVDKLSLDLKRSYQTIERTDRVQKREFIKLQRLNKEVNDTQSEIVLMMSAVIEHRSKETGNHVRRVAEYSKLFALYCGLDIKEADMLKRASPMHDIGKISIPDYILNKPAKLTSNEFTIMMGHSLAGYEMLSHSQKPLLKTAAIIAYEHHEKYDGSGYPKGLKGEAIHLYGRITAFADVFDALGSKRCYKKAWDDEKTFHHLKNETGKHFDPKLSNIFFKHLDEFLSIRTQFSDSNSEH